MGNGTRGASAPWGFRDDAGARGAGARGTTTLSPQPARAARESEAGVGGTIIAVEFYFNLEFYGQLPAPWSGVWIKEQGFG